MEKSRNLMKVVLSFFMVVALVSCGSSGGGSGIDGGRRPATFGSLALSGNDTGGTGTSFRATDLLILTIWQMIPDRLDGITGGITFSSLITEEFNDIEVAISNLATGNIYKYSCEAAINCRGSVVFDASAKTVTFENLEVDVDVNPEEVNKATEPLTLNGTLKYG